MSETAAPAYRSHDISDRIWETIAPHLSGGPGKVRCPAEDNRRFSNAVFWILCTGASRRDLPLNYGHMGNGTLLTAASDAGRRTDTEARLLAAVSDDPDLEWLMIDASNVKVHQHGTGTRDGNQAAGRTKRGLNTKLHLAMDAHGMPVCMAVTAGTVADCTQAEALIDGIDAEYLLADRGYDANRVLAAVRERGMAGVVRIVADGSRYGWWLNLIAVSIGGGCAGT